MILFDNHNHSNFSPDAQKTTIELSTRAAMAAGLGGICFTDHYDIPPQGLIKKGAPAIDNERFNIAEQQGEIDRVRDLLGFNVFKGIELGLSRERREEIKTILKKWSFDQVTVSIHYLDKTDPYEGTYYEGKDFKQAYGHYLETLYEEMVFIEDFDVMGHYDYVTRYPSYPEQSILYKDFSDILDEIFKYLIHNGKALEINTKTYNEYRGREPYLDINVLKRYREMGGEIISLGSDSHQPERVGDKFEWASSLVRSCGFNYLAHYESRRLIML